MSRLSQTKSTNCTVSIVGYGTIQFTEEFVECRNSFVYHQINNYLNTKIEPIQSFPVWFRSYYATVFTKITDDIRMSIENRQWNAQTLLNFSNVKLTLPYYRNHYVQLISSRYWLISTLPLCTSATHVNENCFSTWRGMSSRIPRGNVFLLLNFFISINSITLFLTSSYHLYATDLQIYTQTSHNDLLFVIDVSNLRFKFIIYCSQSLGFLYWLYLLCISYWPWLHTCSFGWYPGTWGYFQMGVLPGSYTLLWLAKA